MSVHIRLSKTGRKHQITFRILAQDSRKKRGGAFLEILGSYNPQDKTPNGLVFKKERVNYWLSKGAQLTEGVTKLLKAKGLTTNAKS